MDTQEENNTINPNQEIINKIDELKALKQAEIKENAKTLELYTIALKKDLEILASNIKSDTLKKQIRLCKKVNAYRQIMIQEVYVNTDGEIVKYGDLLSSGGTATTSGCNRQGLGGFNRVCLPANVEISEVVGGHANFFAIQKDSPNLWVWGNNSQGCLGLGHTNATPIPQKVTFRAKIKQVCSKSYSSSYQFATILLSDGSVWSAGYNAYGSLGIGNTIDSNKFIMIQSLNDVDEIFGGNNYISGVFARKGSELWAWGWNGNYCLGLGHNTNQLTPAKLALKEVIEVYHSTRDSSGWKATTWFKVAQGKWGDGGKTDFYFVGFNGSCESTKAISADYTTPFKAYINFDYNDRIVGNAPYGTMYIATRDGTWNWGYAEYGVGNTRAGTSLQTQKDVSNVFDSIEATEYTYFMACAKRGDTLYTHGYNNWSLGNGNNDNQRQWLAIPTPNGIIDYAIASVYESERALIATDGTTLYACGAVYNNNIDYTTPTLQPQKLPIGAK
ncbi:hypothetical protein BKH46_07450 [Helicobacter sp. 12S02634-8]|uniref:RCC1 domain-containing protein n=1 Tax=Helicobacter sp. 12S02634-8 TaxID=1476199 RepID=UPI000BA78B2C|nr:hypothetical protein [Helicobacter sp. 12S02634-8]PAF46416.1 hypothetical protein BKH46_07450 [Helicobacter sp. 12S02634-8]